MVYLMFNRNCAEALALYAKAFNGTIEELQKYGDAPKNPAFPVQEADKGLVLHARLAIAGSEIMAADATEPCQSGGNMYINIIADKDAVEKAWDALKPGGRIYMELAPSFFAALHGSLQDKYGVNWMFTAV